MRGRAHQLVQVAQVHNLRAVEVRHQRRRHALVPEIAGVGQNLQASRKRGRSGVGGMKKEKEEE
jgi:hypothetical protein